MIKAYFDGACEPNPGGKVCYGGVILHHEKMVYEISKSINIPIELRTNNVAEYCGCIAVMKAIICCDWQYEEIYIFGDSKLVINQMKGAWQINDSAYTKYAYIAQDLLKQFTNIHFEWVPRERNTYADTLSRRAM